MIADTPKVMTEGNWKLGVYVDDGASKEQFDKLAKVFGGALGGPMGALAPVVGEIRGVERAVIEIAAGGLAHRVKVGDSISNGNCGTAASSASSRTASIRAGLSPSCVTRGGNAPSGET